jgi:hypothetical protein
MAERIRRVKLHVVPVRISLPDGDDVDYDRISRIEGFVCEGERIVACCATPTHIYYTLQKDTIEDDTP